MSAESITPRRRRRTAVHAVLATVGLVGCAVSESTLTDEYPALEDSVGFSACNVRSGDAPERLMVNTGSLSRGDDGSPGELPDDIVFTDVIGDSPAGFDFQPIALLTEGTTFTDLLLEQDADAASAMEFVPLPYEPDADASETISIGVIVEIPAAGDSDPPMAIDLRGFTYETGGDTYTFDANVEVWVSTMQDDGTSCTAFNCSMFPFDDGCAPGES